MSESTRPSTAQNKRAAELPADDHAAKKTRPDVDGDDDSVESVDEDSVVSFTEMMGTEILDVYVGTGDEKQLFRVYEKLLRNKVPFFDKMLSSNFKESVEKKIQLPEDDPDSFELLLLWVYTDKLPFLKWTQKLNGASLYTNRNTTELYILADKLCLNHVMDEIATQFIDACDKQGIVPYPYAIESSYSCFSEHMAFRKYFIHCLDYILNGMPRNAPYFQTNTLESITEGFMANKDLTLEYMQLVHQRPVGIPAPNPNQNHRCAYHQHASNVSCPAKKDSK